jgi:hypothetical protein
MIYNAKQGKGTPNYTIRGKDKRNGSRWKISGKK